MNTQADTHLYLLIGQSNMAGRGVVDDVGRMPDPRIIALGRDETWAPAVDPLHFDKPEAGVGPGLGFAQRMVAEDPVLRIGLVPCAVGGTSIRLWVPGARDPVTKAFPYDDTLRRMRAAAPAGALKGILWHQGEADRGAPETYGPLLTALVAKLRIDLDATEVPFVAGELACFRPEQQAATQAFNAALHALGATIPRFGVVGSQGLSDKGDRLHLDTASARLLGGRYAEQMILRQRR